MAATVAQTISLRGFLDTLSEQEATTGQTGTAVSRTFTHFQTTLAAPLDRVVATFAKQLFATSYISRSDFPALKHAYDYIHANPALLTPEQHCRLASLLEHFTIIPPQSPEDMLVTMGFSAEESASLAESAEPYLRDCKYPEDKMLALALFTKLPLPAFKQVFSILFNAYISCSMMDRIDKAQKYGLLRIVLSSPADDLPVAFKLFIFPEPSYLACGVLEKTLESIREFRAKGGDPKVAASLIEKVPSAGLRSALIQAMTLVPLEAFTEQFFPALVFSISSLMTQQDLTILKTLPQDHLVAILTAAEQIAKKCRVSSPYEKLGIIQAVANLPSEHRAAILASIDPLLAKVGAEFQIYNILSAMGKFVREGHTIDECNAIVASVTKLVKGWAHAQTLTGMFICLAKVAPEDRDALVALAEPHIGGVEGWSGETTLFGGFFVALPLAEVRRILDLGRPFLEHLNPTAKESFLVHIARMPEEKRAAYLQAAGPFVQGLQARDYLSDLLTAMDELLSQGHEANFPLAAPYTEQLTTSKERIALLRATTLFTPQSLTPEILSTFVSLFRGLPPEPGIRPPLYIERYIGEKIRASLNHAPASCRSTVLLSASRIIKENTIIQEADMAQVIEALATIAHLPKDQYDFIFSVAVPLITARNVSSCKVLFETLKHITETHGIDKCRAATTLTANLMGGIPGSLYLADMLKTAVLFESSDRSQMLSSLIPLIKGLRYDTDRVAVLQFFGGIRTDQFTTILSIARPFMERPGACHLGRLQEDILAIPQSKRIAALASLEPFMEGLADGLHLSDVITHVMALIPDNNYRTAIGAVVRPFISQFPSGPTRVQFLAELMKFPETDRLSIIESAMPFLLKVKDDAYDISQVLTAIVELPAAERGGILWRAKPLTEGMTKGYQIAETIKTIADIQSVGGRSSNHDTQEALIASARFALEGIEDGELYHVLRVMKAIPPRDASAIAEVAAPFIARTTKGHERSQLIGAFAAIPSNERRDVLALAAPLTDKMTAMSDISHVLGSIHSLSRERCSNIPAIIQLAGLIFETTPTANGGMIVSFLSKLPVGEDVYDLFRLSAPLLEGLNDISKATLAVYVAGIPANLRAQVINIAVSHDLKQKNCSAGLSLLLNALQFLVTHVPLDQLDAILEEAAPIIKAKNTVTVDHVITDLLATRAANAHGLLEGRSAQERASIISSLGYLIKFVPFDQQADAVEQAARFIRETPTLNQARTAVDVLVRDRMPRTVEVRA